jgi:hypothetical protein
MITLNLSECNIAVINYGQMGNENYAITQVVFTHPKYMVYSEDSTMEQLLDEYAKAFVVFEINYN